MRCTNQNEKKSGKDNEKRVGSDREKKKEYEKRAAKQLNFNLCSQTQQQKYMLTHRYRGWHTHTHGSVCTQIIFILRGKLF